MYTINFTIVEPRKWNWVSTGQVSCAQLNWVSFLSTMFANKMVRRYLATCHWHIDSKWFPIFAIVNKVNKFSKQKLITFSGYRVPIKFLLTHNISETLPRGKQPSAAIWIFADTRWNPCGRPDPSTTVLSLIRSCKLCTLFYLLLSYFPGDLPLTSTNIIL